MKEYQSLQLEQLKQFFELPRDQRKLEQKYMKPMMHDKLYLRTGIDHMTFEMIWANLGMESDKEYLAMKKDFDQAIDYLKSEAKRRDGPTNPEEKSTAESVENKKEETK